MRSRSRNSGHENLLEPEQPPGFLILSYSWLRSQLGIKGEESSPKAAKKRSCARHEQEGSHDSPRSSRPGRALGSRQGVDPTSGRVSEPELLQERVAWFPTGGAGILRSQCAHSPQSTNSPTHGSSPGVAPSSC